MKACQYCSAGTTGDWVDMQGRPICGGCRRDKIAPFHKSKKRAAVEERAAKKQAEESRRVTEPRVRTSPIEQMIGGDAGLRALMSKHLKRGQA